MTDGGVQRDLDPKTQENREWLESLDYVLRTQGPPRAVELISVARSCRMVCRPTKPRPRMSMLAANTAGGQRGISARKDAPISPPPGPP